MIKFVRRILDQKKWERWNNTPKDLVILHTFGRAETVPSGSPFIVKVQTYLRMTAIPHKIDSKDKLGPKGKAPWISLNGTHIGDSELIIKHLNQHFNKDLNRGPYSKSQLALATCARITLEEHFLWGLALERFVFNPTQFRKVVTVNPFYDNLLVRLGGIAVKKRAEGQGLGRHTKGEVEELCTKDLYEISTLLGKNKFFLGDVPCQDDCAIFGILSVVKWGLPCSPYEKILHSSDLANLQDYCLRIKEIYWSDWDQCIRKGSKAQSNVKAASRAITG